MKKPVLCRHCLQEQSAHTPSWRCQNFEPKTRRVSKRTRASSSSTSPAAPPPSVDYIVQAVRTQLAQTFRYLASVLEVDASVISKAVGAAPPPTTPNLVLEQPELAPKRASSSPPAAPIDARAIPLVAASLGDGHRKILVALAQSPSGALTRVNLRIVTEHARSTLNRLLQELARFGFVDTDGEDPRITEQGKSALGPSFERLPEGDELRAKWMRELGAGHAEVLGVICRAYPEWIEREAVGEQTEHARSTRNRFIQELAARELVTTTSKRVRAADFLFSRPRAPLGVSHHRGAA